MSARLRILLGGLAPLILLTTQAASAARPTFHADPDYLIDAWTTEDGLPANSVITMAQTTDGYLWFGSYSGLARFDGVKFVVFDSFNTPKLPGNDIIKLHADQGGKLWVGTARGLAVRHGEQWQFPGTTGTNEPWGRNVARSFSERRNGDLLVTTDTGEVLEFSGGKLHALPAPPGAAGQRYLGHADETGQWWVTQHQFIGRWDGTRWQPMVPLAGLTNLALDSVGCASARDGGLWLLLGRELRKYRSGAEVSHRTLPEFRGVFADMSEDSRGNVWICTYDHGLWQIGSNGPMRHWSRSNGLPDNHVLFAREDAEKSIWVGTMQGGLLRFKERAFRSILTVTNRAEPSLFAVAAHPAGGVVIAKYAQGLSRFDQGVLTNVTLPPPLRGLDVSARSLLVEHTGRTWLGGWSDGVWILDDQTNRHLPKEQAGGRNVGALFEDSRGRIWMAGGKSVAVYEKGEVRDYGPQQGIPVGAAWSFAEDTTGTLWLAHERGVFRLATNCFIPVLESNGRTNRANGLHADSAGGMWMGTINSGLRFWSEGRIVQRELLPELPMRGVWGFVEDNQGFFWMPSNNGILRVRRSELKSWLEGAPAAPTFQVFDLADGLPDVRCGSGHTAATARDTQGRLWFAMPKGVAMVDPAALRLNAVPPPVQIEEMTYHRASGRVYAGETARPPAPSVQTRLRAPLADHVTLPPDSRRVRIQYTALSFAAPEKVRFQVKLEPGDADWQDAGDRRAADYYDFRPGTYTFRVRAANNDAMWNQAGASLAFTVQPFFWQTAWFKILGLLALAAAIYGSVHRRVVRLEKERTAQQSFTRQLILSQENERKRVAAELHDGLGQNLLLIKNRLAMAATRQADAAELARQLDAATAATTQAIREVRAISHALRPAALEQVGLTKAIEWMVEQLGEGSATQFSAELDTIDGLLAPEMEMNLFRIIQEGLNNVVRHAGATHVILEMKREETGLRLSLFDDGSGFDAENLRAEKGERRGLGLASLAERVKYLGGTMELQSAPGRGTRLTVSVPPPKK